MSATMTTAVITILTGVGGILVGWLMKSLKSFLAAKATSLSDLSSRITGLIAEAEEQYSNFKGTDKKNWVRDQLYLLFPDLKNVPSSMVEAAIQAGFDLVASFAKTKYGTQIAETVSSAAASAEAVLDTAVEKLAEVTDAGTDSATPVPTTETVTAETVAG